MSVTHPSGFLAAGLAAGFKASGRPDLALLVPAGGPAAAAGLFTRNAFAAPPVHLTRAHLLSGRAAGLVVNSGQANAGTGPGGMDDARAMAAETAAILGCAPEDVAVCSTGVIGAPVAMDAFRSAIPRVAAAVSAEGGPDFATAILTTDSRPKQAVAESDGYRIGGCAKGAGMIAPDLATLLVFLTTDAEASPELLRRVLREHAAPVWNAVSVDGCSSTNDTVLLLSSGASGRSVPDEGPEAAAFGEAVAEVCEDLARQVLLDAEGATRAIVVHVDGAGTTDQAAAVARSVSGSLLVKTAVFGSDPNPGRILQAIGSSGAPVDPGAVSATVGGVTLVAGGAVVPFDREAAVAALGGREVVFRIGLGDGPGTATAFGCDLGYDYVRINAEYTT